MDVALERKLDGERKALRVADGKLDLNVDKDGQKRWLDDLTGPLTEAEQHWPQLKSRVPTSQ